MKHYWLCIVDEGNWEIVKRKRIWGVSDRHKKKLEMVEEGDLMIFYIKPTRIGGIFKCISKPYVDREKIFDGEELFPNRIKLEPIVMPESPLDFKPLIPKLKFIAKKRGGKINKKWGAYLFGKAIRPIPHVDYKTIESALTGG
jgi:predicted RNA-binding protein